MREILGVDSRVLYLLLLGVVIVERLVELSIAKRNTRDLLRRGALEVGSGHYPTMVLMHTLFLISAPLEVWLLDRPLIPVLAVGMLLLLVGAMALRYWVIATLGERWTTRIICLPGSPLIATGPYRYLQHPNYLAVVVETFALPMVHTAWLTAIVFTLCNALLLRVRIDVEDKALWRYAAYFDAVEARTDMELPT